MGCHDGTVPRHEAVQTLERAGRWLASTWATRGPHGVEHAAATGEEPELDQVPLWVERERIAAGSLEVLFAVVLEELAGAGVTGAKVVHRRGERVVAVLGLEPAAVVALDGRLAARLGKAARVRVRRGVARS